MKRREKEVIRCIYYKDVANLFRTMGLSEKLARSEIRCSICGEVITPDNFRAVTRKSEKLLFCCDKESCILSFTSHLGGGKA
jgi:hypothetical protein